MTPPIKLLCAGLPGTGKTTFLVALYHALESGSVAGGLRLVDGTLFEADRDYIQAQRESWLDWKTVERNKTDAKDSIVLSLTDLASGMNVNVDVPDLSGEAFRVQVDERIIANSLRTRLAECNGLLLFVSPPSIVEPTTIDDADGVLEQLETPDSKGEEGDDNDESADDSAAGEGFLPEHCCTAAKLVEILQFSVPLVRRRPLPVALVISAFDLLENTPHRSSPQSFVDAKLSLVDQYLRANPEYFKYSVFGLSAQGADYKNRAAVDRASRARTAAERVRLLPVPSTGEHDITFLIRWLVEQSQ